MLLAGWRFKFLCGPLQRPFIGAPGSSALPCTIAAAAARLRPPPAVLTALSWLCCHVFPLSVALSDLTAVFPHHPRTVCHLPLAEPASCFLRGPRCVGLHVAPPGAAARVRSQASSPLDTRSSAHGLIWSRIHLFFSVIEKHVLPAGTGRKKSVRIVWQTTKMFCGVTF